MYSAKEMQLQYNIKWMKPDNEEIAFQELERVGDFLNGLRLAFYNSGYNDSLVIGACRKAVNDINAACDKFISTIRPEDQDSPDQQANDKNVEPPKWMTVKNTDPEVLAREVEDGNISAENFSADIVEKVAQIIARDIVKDNINTENIPANIMEKVNQVIDREGAAE